jgi:hypothetical protein
MIDYRYFDTQNITPRYEFWFVELHHVLRLKFERGESVRRRRYNVKATNDADTARWEPGAV